MSSFLMVLLGFIAGSFFTCGVIGMFMTLKGVSKILIDRTCKNYTVVEFDVNGEKSTAHYSKHGYQHIFTEKPKDKKK